MTGHRREKGSGPCRSDPERTPSFEVPRAPRDGSRERRRAGSEPSTPLDHVIPCQDLRPGLARQASNGPLRTSPQLRFGIEHPSRAPSVVELPRKRCSRPFRSSGSRWHSFTTDTRLDGWRDETIPDRSRGVAGSGLRAGPSVSSDEDHACHLKRSSRSRVSRSQAPIQEVDGRPRTNRLKPLFDQSSTLLLSRRESRSLVGSISGTPVYDPAGRCSGGLRAAPTNGDS